MVAFVASIVVTFLALIPVPIYAKRRPPGTPLSWGEALLAATYVFFLFWWAYGVVPHLWLTWADNELGWRADRVLYGFSDFLRPQSEGGWLPFTITFQTLRDLIAVVIYGVFLVLPIGFWAYWQGRGERKAPEIVTTTYGRPLVRKG